jgi:hypothetical protein
MTVAHLLAPLPSTKDSRHYSKTISRLTLVIYFGFFMRI